MMVVKKTMIAFSLFCSLGVSSQPPNQTFVNNLPDLHPPTPDVSQILKAEQLGISYTTGTPGFTIPLFSFAAGNFSLPISLNYNSAGITVDEVASSVGMGWNLSAGGVVSRVIYDKPDESRNNSNCNLNNIDPSQYSQALLNFLEYAPDKESDIFNFSFPGGSGKFIIGLDGQPKQLTQLNMKVSVIGNNFLNGFIITTDDGTEYQFTIAEITNNREPLTDWGKTYTWSNFKTSWHLSKIVLPGQSKWIDFQYTGSNINYESSIIQTLSKINTTSPDCSGGTVCPLGSTVYQTTVHRQLTEAKFLLSIISSDGDYVSFGYGNRVDMQGGLYLATINLYNRNGSRIKWIDLTTTNYTTISSNNSGLYVNYPAAQKRLFLQSLSIYGQTNNNPLTYSFQYNNPGQLPPRLSYAQDIYGYYNGKTANGSLIPILNASDINYSAFPPTGSSSGSIQFGDRSVDTTKSKNGLLIGITYPTGGYDVITYRANRHNNLFAGGHSVSKISTYSAPNVLAFEREFLYQNMDGSSSSFTLSTNLLFSVVKKTYDNPCSMPDPNFPTCTHSVLTSNITNPLVMLGGQSLYYRSVIECNKDAAGDNGAIEHLYSYFMGGNLDPRTRMGDRILTTPFQVVPDFQRGETFTNVYRRNGTNLELIKKTERNYRNDNLVEYYNYVINKKYNYTGGIYNPPVEAQFLPYDMEQVYINCYTPRLVWVEETDYSVNGTTSVKRTEYEYSNPNYTYSTKATVTGSDNIVQWVERKYPHDIPAYAFMVNRNIISPVLEEKTYRGAGQGVLLATKTQHFKDWFNDGKVIAPEWVTLVLKTNTEGSKVVYHKYDSHGNVQELSKENDVHQVFLYGYKSTVPIARIVNSTFDVVSGYINQAILDNPSSESELKNQLDNLRSIQGALVTTYTYKPLIGITSETDPNDRTTYYEYDAYGRLILIRDNEKNILKKICYNYAGQAQNCEMFGNDAVTVSYTKSNCPTDYVGTAGTYTIPVSSFFSAISSADATAMATNYANLHGQDFVNNSSSSGATCEPMVKAFNQTGTAFYVTLTKLPENIIYSYSAYPNSSSSQIGQVPAGNYNIQITPYTTGYSSQLTLNGTTQSGTSYVYNNYSISTPMYLSFSNATVPCSFSMSSGFSSASSNIVNNGSSVSFYLAFYGYSSMTPGNSYYVATINGSCRPSGTRTIYASSGGRNWTITILSSGQMYFYLQPGSTSVSAYSAISTGTLTYSL